MDKACVVGLRRSVHNGQEVGDRKLQVARIQDGVMRLTAARLGAWWEGLDWRRVHGGRSPIAPRIAG